MDHVCNNATHRIDSSQNTLGWKRCLILRKKRVSLRRKLFFIKVHSHHFDIGTDWHLFEKKSVNWTTLYKLKGFSAKIVDNWWDIIQCACNQFDSWNRTNLMISFKSISGMICRSGWKSVPISFWYKWALMKNKSKTIQQIATFIHAVSKVTSART